MYYFLKFFQAAFLVWCFGAYFLSVGSTNNKLNKEYTVFVALWSGEDDLFHGFRDYLSEKKIKIKYVIENCAQDRKKCHALVPKIRQLKPDLIFTWGTPVCEEIGGKFDIPDPQNYIRDIPMVSLIVTDPIASKLIKSLEKTERNITGVNHVAPVSSHIEAIKSFRKTTKKVAAFYNPAETNSVIMINQLKNLSKKYDIVVGDFPIKLDESGKPLPSSIEGIIDKIAVGDYDFIYMPADTFLSVNLKKVMERANFYKIPTFGSTESMFFGGHPLMGLISRFYDVGYFGGQKAERILIKGEAPQDIPYEKLKEFSFLIGADVFNEIKIFPPLSLVKYAQFIGANKEEEKKKNHKTDKDKERK